MNEQFLIFTKGYILENKGLFATYLLIVMAFFFVEVFLLSKIKSNIIKSIYGNANSSPNLMKQPTFVLMLLFAAICGGLLLFGYIIDLMETSLITRFTSNFRNVVFESTINAFNESFQEIEVGDQISKSVLLKRETKGLIHAFFKHFLIKTLLVVFIAFYLFYKFPSLGIVPIVTVALTALFYAFFGGSIFEKSTEKYRINNQMHEQESDIFHNLSHIYINNENDTEIQEQEKRTDMYHKINIDLETYTNNIAAGTKVACLVMICVFMYLLYLQFRSKRVAKEDFVLVVILITVFMNSYFDMVETTNHLLYQAGMVEACADILHPAGDSIKNDAETNRKHADLIREGDIVFEDVTYKYIDEEDQSEKYLFEGIHIEFPAKQVTAIVGPSGSGKSTLCHLILKLQRPQSGNIFIDGLRYEDLDASVLRQKVVYVNQRTNLFSGTIMENILYGNEGVTEEYVSAFIDKNQLGTVFEEIEGGLYGDCGVNGSKLSLGMQKITILLRGILKKGYCVILFDEPLAGLDGDSRKKVIQLIQTTGRDKTVIIVTHEKEILGICDQVIRMQDIKS